MSCDSKKPASLQSQQTTGDPPTLSVKVMIFQSTLKVLDLVIKSQVRSTMLLWKSVPYQIGEMTVVSQEM